VFVKIILVQVLSFILILFCYDAIIKLTQRYLSKTKYKLTPKSSYFLAYLIVFSAAIVLGKELVYDFL
jgi:hypothetical protein